MIRVSEAFRAAMESNAPQRPLIDFGCGEAIGTLFTAEDISIEDGIRYSEPLNTDTDLTMGGCPSSTLSFTLLNERKRLKDFTFGRCKAWLGVMIRDFEYLNNDKLTLVYDANGSHIHYEDGKLYLNDTASSVRPQIVPGSLYMNDGYLLLFDEEGQHEVYAVTDRAITATDKTFDLDTLMVDKVRGWAEDGVCISRKDGTLIETIGSQVSVWEYLPLGVFVAERPKVANNATISVRCKDRMGDFDKECNNMSVKNLTLWQILKKACDECDVPLAVTQEQMTNGDLLVTKQPSDLKTATYRDIVGWCAEASCSFARFNRDGELELAWFAPAEEDGLVLTEEDYETYQEYWYETRDIEKLVVRDSKVSTDTVMGDGDNGYIIENNPFLGGAK